MRARPSSTEPSFDPRRASPARARISMNALAANSAATSRSSRVSRRRPPTGRAYRPGAGMIGAVHDAGDGRGQPAGRYPEVVAAGDAGRAWQAEFDRQGAPLRAHGREGVDPLRAARVENGELHA